MTAVEYRSRSRWWLRMPLWLTIPLIVVALVGVAAEALILIGLAVGPGPY